MYNKVSIVELTVVSVLIILGVYFLVQMWIAASDLDHQLPAIEIPPYNIHYS